MTQPNNPDNLTVEDAAKQIATWTFGSSDDKDIQEVKAKIQAVVQSATQELAGEVERLTRANEQTQRLYEQETDKLLTERDDAEDFANNLYAAVMGHSPEWSNAYGYPNALDDCEAKIAQLQQSETRVGELEKLLAQTPAKPGQGAMPQDGTLLLTYDDLMGWEITSWATYKSIARDDDEEVTGWTSDHMTPTVWDGPLPDAWWILPAEWKPAKALAIKEMEGGK